MNPNEVIVIGAGGTGSILIPNLARFLNSINFEGSLVIADGDSYDEGNIDRQSFSLQHVGLNKSEYQALVVSSQIPNFANNVDFIPEYLSKEDIDTLIDENSVVINCADNNTVRIFVENRVNELNDAVHICCGNDLRSGQVQISMVRNGERLTPTIFDEAPDLQNEDEDRSQMSCEEIAQLPSGGQLIAANMMSASLALCYVVQLMGNRPLNRNGTFIMHAFTYFDVLTNSFESKSQGRIKELV